MCEQQQITEMIFIFVEVEIVIQCELDDVIVMTLISIELV
jgi:hypothetical protein